MSPTSCPPIEYNDLRATTLYYKVTRLRINCGSQRFSPEPVVDRFMHKHGSDKVHEGAVEPFCDTILFRRVGRSHLMLRSAFTKVGLKLVGKVFTTPVTT